MVGATQQFGSAHTERKLRAVQSYLQAFTTALKKQSFELLYVDACAGSGSSSPRRDGGQGQLLDVDEITIGSAVRARDCNAIRPLRAERRKAEERALASGNCA